MSDARKPDYRLKALNKDTDERNTIGAAWLNADGSISISLEAFIVLQASPHLVLTLFTIDDTKKKA